MSRVLGKRIYPNVDRWMRINDVDCVALAKQMGVVHGTVYHMLSGGNPTKFVIDRLLEVTGLTYEQAFREEV